MMSLLLALIACTGPPADSDSGAVDVDSSDDGGPEPEAPPAFHRLPDVPDQHAGDGVVEIALTATTAVHDLGRGQLVDGYGYGGVAPGYTVRAKVGEELVVSLDNQLDQPTTLHWHGLKVPEAVDGALWMREPIPAGGSATVRFTAAQAGTFWVHPHFDTARQVDLGLYAAVVIEAADPPAVSDDVVMVLDRWGEHDGVSETGWTVNGRLQPHWERSEAGWVRARLLNASNHGWLRLDDVLVVALDQGLLPKPMSGVLLAPGDRAEVLLPVAGTGSLQSTPSSAVGDTLGEPITLLTWAAPEQVLDPLPWPEQPALPSADPGTTDIRYTLTGSDAGGWEINGETFPDITVEQLGLGSTGVIEVRNVSGSRHPFHVHGLVFEVLSVDGVAPEQQLVEDTLDVGIGSVVRLLVEADNPGEWMVHCHLLGHAEDGMMTVLSVR